MPRLNQRTFAAYAVVAVLAASSINCGGAPTAKAPAAPTPTPAVQVDDLVALFADLNEVPFSVDDHQRGCPTDQTLGEYVAMLERNGRGDAEGVYSLTGGCDGFPAEPLPIDLPATTTTQYCQIIADVDPDGDSPWHYELRFRRDARTGELDRTAFSCPGSS